MTLALIRHNRFMAPMDSAKLEALADLFSEGWTDRESVCVERVVELLEEFDATIDFRYYDRDLNPLWEHSVGAEECAELEDLKAYMRSESR